MHDYPVPLDFFVQSTNEYMKKEDTTMKKLVCLVLVLVLSLCAVSAFAEAAPKKAALVMRTLGDPFAALAANTFLEKAEAYKDQFTLEVLDAQGDAEKSNALIENCITKGYDLVIIVPVDSELQRPYAQMVADAGIHVITTSAKIDGIVGGSTVDADPYKQGAMIAELAVKNVPENGKAVIMGCLPGNAHCIARLQAFKDIFVAQRPDVEILGEKILQGASEAEAMALMEDWVQAYGDFDAVLTVADAVGLGVMEAIKDNPAFDDLQIYGVDGLTGAVQGIIDGTFTATVFQDARMLAEQNLIAASKLLSGEETQLDLVYDDTLVTIENAEAILPNAN